MNRYVSKAIRDLEFVYDMETRNFATNLVSQNRIPTNRRFDVGGVPYDIRSLRNLLNSGIDRVPHDPGKKLNRAAIDVAMPPTLTSVEAIVPEPSRNTSSNGLPFSSNGLPFSATTDANRMSIVISLDDDDHYYSIGDETIEEYDERAEWTLPLWKRMADRWASVAAAEIMPLRLKKTRRQNRETAIAKMLIDKINDDEAARVLDAVRRAYLRGGGRAMPTLRLVSKKDGSWTVEHPAFRISVFSGKNEGGVVWWKTEEDNVQWGSILLVWYAIKKVFGIDRLYLSDEVSGNSHPLNEFARRFV
jgi:hypothetical protein